MGKYLRPGTSECYDYTPDDDDDTLHIECNYASIGLQELLDRITAKWRDRYTLEDLTIQPMKIHTAALGYDRYDPSDYTEYLIIRTPNAKSHDYPW